jgi:Flp pilus assembly protein TadB
MLPPSRQARAQATRQWGAEQSRSRAWLVATAACAALVPASLFMVPPLAIVFAALTALCASRWRHHRHAARALSRRRPSFPPS